ncbi:MFS transporter [Nocardia camponoti]|uniref:MFS transporter n=1 Tax=Nocardia camponoti TaxID=1616106 RepID=A0A917QCR4_9NOCA|nr:MFS transporter [Nocardia camponoti]GGK43511.1 MFS transporter [Nocardia camponoti]
MVFLLAAAAAPSPLYPVYQQAWGFSAFTLTVIFAVYVVALVVAMLLLGSLPDVIGRRPVLIGGLLVLAVSMLLFIHASDVSGLIAARVVQGIATGVCTGAATAMIVDLQPNPQIGSVVSGGASPVGLALGAAVAGALVQYAPWPRYLIYWVLFACYLVLILALAALPRAQRAQARSEPLLDALRPRVGVPEKARPMFIAIVPALLATWAPCGLYLSLGPSMLQELLDVHNHFVVGLILASFFAPAPLATLAAARLHPTTRRLTGFGMLGVGVALTIVAVLTKSLALYLVASVLAGAGFGITFSLTMATIAAATAARDRAKTFALTFAVAYTAFSVPAVLAGLAAQHWHLRSTFVVYGVIEVIVVVVAALAAQRAQHTQKGVTA